MDDRQNSSVSRKFKVVGIRFLENALVTREYINEVEEPVVGLTFGVLINEDEDYYYVANNFLGGTSDADIFKVLKKIVLEIEEFGELEL